MGLSSMPIMSEAELRRLPTPLLAAAAAEYTQRVEREARIAAAKERYRPDPEGSARLQALIDEERRAKREDAA